MECSRISLILIGVPKPTNSKLQKRSEPKLVRFIVFNQIITSLISKLKLETTYWQSLIVTDELFIVEDNDSTYMGFEDDGKKIIFFLSTLER